MTTEARTDIQAGKPKERSPVLYGLLVAIGVTLLFQLGAAIASSRLAETALGPWMLAISQVSLMLVPTIYMARAQSLPATELFRLRGAQWRYFVAVAGGIVALWPIEQAFLVAQELYLIPEGLLDAYRSFERELTVMYVKLFPHGDALVIARSMIVGAVVPAISEELLFRGAVQRSFERRTSATTAIALSSILFTVLHLQPNNVVPLLLLGGFLGLIARASRSIWPAVFGHFLFNGIMLAVLYALRSAGQPISGPRTESELLEILPFAGLALVPMVFIVRWLVQQIRSEAQA